MENVARIIGYAIFAVAKADKKVSPEERQVAHSVNNENWKLLADNEDPFGVRALDFIDKMLIVLDEKELHAERAFELFESEYELFANEFSDELKDFTLNVCVETASALNRRNKSELIMLSRIEKILKNA